MEATRGHFSQVQAVIGTADRERASSISLIASRYVVFRSMYVARNIRALLSFAE